MLRSLRPMCVVGMCVVVLAAPRAQQEAQPSARLISAPRLVMPGAIDSNVPMTWALADGTWRLFALASWGGSPALLSGLALDQMQKAGAVTIVPHPGHGVWIESVIADDAGTWYGYYHHERPAEACGRPDRFLPRIGSARSTDRGLTWEDLGIVLDAPPDSAACASSNRYVIGGVGDVSAMLTPDRRGLILFVSQYSRKTPSEQGVAVARLVWADRDAPEGRVMVWRAGAWIPAASVAGADADSPTGWEYPAGSPLAPVSRPWHDADGAADAFWGPSVHWNTYLDRYVILINRAKNEYFNNEGIYVAYARVLDDPQTWSVPQKIMDGGGWYPQVAGLEPMTGTDKQAGQRARFFATGRSDHFIEFQR